MLVGIITFIEFNAPTVVGALIILLVGTILLCWAHDLVMKDQDERIDKIFNDNRKPRIEESKPTTCSLYLLASMRIRELRKIQTPWPKEVDIDHVEFNAINKEIRILDEYLKFVDSNTPTYYGGGGNYPKPPEDRNINLGKPTGSTRPNSKYTK